MAKFKQSVKKENISLRRRASIYYKRLTLLLKLVFVILAILLLFTNILNSFTGAVRQRVSQECAKYGFTLSNVVIEGQKNASVEDIVEIIGSDKGAPIFAIKLDEIREHLESHIWIRSAIVERRLPDTIYVAVTERTPIAIWQFNQKLYVVDAEGNCITKYQGEGFEDLIQVVGQDANIYAKSLIDELARYPGLAEKVKSAVRYGNRRWNLNLDQKITVKMPENNFAAAYDYLYSLHKKQKLFDQDYKVLDLRNANKFYLEKYKKSSKG
jgi:cell division protein FtsQ